MPPAVRAGSLLRIVLCAATLCGSSCIGRSVFFVEDSVAGTFLGPPDCPSIGETCDDGTIFVGYHPRSGVALFLHPRAFGRTQWSTVNEVTGADDRDDGSANQRTIEARGNASDYLAFAPCTQASQENAFGHDDWYLPSQLEYMKLRWHRDQLHAGEADPFAVEMHWASTEVDIDFAKKQVFELDSLISSGNGKQLTRHRRCIRGEASRVADLQWCDAQGRECLNPGDVRADGSIFGGWHPMHHEPIFLHPDEQADTNWSVVDEDMGADHPWDGMSNQVRIENQATLADYPAFEACNALNSRATDNLGHADWYLPSAIELNVLWAINDIISSNQTVGSIMGLTWSSTEIDAAQAYRQDWSGLVQGEKTTAFHQIFCVRRGP